LVHQGSPYPAVGRYGDDHDLVLAMTHQIRSLVISVHPVRLSAICAGQLRCRFQPDGL